jgi:hypothetical protein
VVPVGSWRSWVWETAVTWAIARSIRARGWKKILTTATPRSDCDSMCWMSSTVVVSDRSVTETMRFAISSGSSPV